METRIVRHTDLGAFSARAAPWLLRVEAEHNLILALLAQLRAEERPGSTSPYLVTVEQDGLVIGCAVRTPPHKLIITRMPAAVIPALVADAAACYGSLPAVLGPESTAREFGRLWMLRNAVQTREGLRQRLYELKQLRPPSGAAPGAMRHATLQDLPLVVSWIDDFAKESQIRVKPERHAARRIEAGDIVLWCTDRPCSMAGIAGRSRSGSRIGYVYTPPDQRDRGYATACVATLTQRELAMGAAFCCLFTDLSNRTSNSIYQQIGFAPVCDFIDMVFEPAE